MKSLIIYHDYIPKIGGIESAVFNLAKILSDTFKITIVFNNVEDNKSLFKYAEVADIKKILPMQIIKCDVLLIASNHAVPSRIKYKKLLQWIHSDYKKYKIKLRNTDKVDQYIAVSQHASDVAKELFGVESITIQNLLDPDFKLPENKNKLKLVTNSRISPEKGFERMYKFALGLKENNIDFEWTIYGDNSKSRAYEQNMKDLFSNIPEVLFVGFKEDIRHGLMNVDYLVQLSDFEGCPYAVLEALSVGVPCILTDFPSAKELIHSKNGYIVPMDLEGVDYKKIATKIPKTFTFNQKGLKEEWIKIIK